MLVLGFDTSTPACTVALCEVPAAVPAAVSAPGDVRELARREVVDPRRHGELLAPLISETLQAGGITPAGLGAIVVGVGPGPYTSLRVGIVTAAAFADALSISAYGICSLDGLSPAAGPGAAELLTVATDARRKEVYWARYGEGRRIEGPAVNSPADVAAGLAPGERVVGGGAELYADLFGTAFDAASQRYPDPVRLITLAAPLLACAAGPLVPLYLRRPDATPRVAA